MPSFRHDKIYLVRPYASKFDRPYSFFCKDLRHRREFEMTINRAFSKTDTRTGGEFGLVGFLVV